jgi:hypothetical protein
MYYRYLNRFILASAVTIVLVACGGTSVKPSPAQAPQATSAPEAYAAEALATYQVQRDGARAYTLITSATKQAPKRIDLALLQLSLCKLIEGCQPEPFEAQFRKLDPGNGVVWVRALAEAQTRRETAVEVQILDALGQSQRFDIYWNRLTSTVTSARIGNGAAANAALGETASWLGSTIVPSFQTITISCARARTGQQDWTNRCRKVAEVLMNSDTYIAESIGIGLAQQVTADPAEIDKLATRARTARYLWQASSEIINSQVERDKFALELLELMRKLRREQDVQMAVLRWAGRPLVPPPGWVPEQ